LLGSRDGHFLDRDEELSFSAAIRANENVGAFRVCVTLHTDDHLPIGSAFSGMVDELAAHQTRTLTISLSPLCLAPGEYYCMVWIVDARMGFGDLHDAVSEVLHFRVAGGSAREVGGWIPAWGAMRMPSLSVEPPSAAVLSEAGAHE
jgi:hypothetical protein